MLHMQELDYSAGLMEVKASRIPGIYGAFAKGGE